ncbi:MAG: hypothetical protein R2855_16300 [Thermomicrobiales bacterium]
MEQQLTPPPMVKERYSSRARWLTNIALILVSLLFAVPFLWIVAAAFDGDAGSTPRLNEPTDTSLSLRRTRCRARAAQSASAPVSVSDALATVLASLAGFALSRLRFRHKTYAVYAVLLLYAIPIAATMGGDLRPGRPARLHRHSFRGLILAQTAMILPFLIWLMKVLRWLAALPG